MTSYLTKQLLIDPSGKVSSFQTFVWGFNIVTNVDILRTKFDEEYAVLKVM